ncbi:hypothetical protein [Collimonas sp. OK607]|uniref:hypothetical protein n=1 Tax=Collimonas sp. OK607 TaxID=1798194 RepID=UPI0014819872|nr:hypothetical protein [Collimonas sp. OK607]
MSAIDSTPHFDERNVAEIMVNSGGQPSGATYEEEHPFFAMFEKNRLKTNI